MKWKLCCINRASGSFAFFLNQSYQFVICLSIFTQFLLFCLPLIMIAKQQLGTLELQWLQSLSILWDPKFVKSRWRRDSSYLGHCSVAVTFVPDCNSGFKMASPANNLIGRNWIQISTHKKSYPKFEWIKNKSCDSIHAWLRCFSFSFICFKFTRYNLYIILILQLN